MTPQELKAMRRQLRLTQADLAKLFGKSRNAIILWERGKSRIPRWLPYALEGYASQSLRKAS